MDRDACPLVPTLHERSRPPRSCCTLAVSGGEVASRALCTHGVTAALGTTLASEDATFPSFSSRNASVRVVACKPRLTWSEDGRAQRPLAPVARRLAGLRRGIANELSVETAKIGPPRIAFSAHVGRLGSQPPFAQAPARAAVSSNTVPPVAYRVATCALIRIVAFLPRRHGLDAAGNFLTRGPVGADEPTLTGPKLQPAIGSNVAAAFPLTGAHPS